MSTTQTLNKELYLERLIDSVCGPVSAATLEDIRFRGEVLGNEVPTIPMTFSEMKQVAQENPNIFIVVEGVHSEYIDTKKFLNQKKYSL